MSGKRKARRARRARRSILRMIIGWIGGRMLRRVQRRSLQSITDRPGSRSSRLRVPASASALLQRIPRPASKRPSGTKPAPSPVRSTRSRTAGKGFAVALLSAAAVAAIKVGVDHVIESERDQQVVTPDFDVFGDDEE